MKLISKIAGFEADYEQLIKFNYRIAGTVLQYGGSFCDIMTF